MPEHLDRERFRVYELGHPAIDSEHYALLRKTGYARFVAHKGDVKVLSRVMSEIQVDMAKHFYHEEQLMLKSSFPYMDWHVTVHKAILKELAKVMDHFVLPKNKFIAERDLVIALEKAVLNHIDEMDRQFVMFLMSSVKTA